MVPGARVDDLVPREAAALVRRRRRNGHEGVQHPWGQGPAGGRHVDVVCHKPGDNCIKIGLSGKLILSKRKGLREVLFS